MKKITVMKRIAELDKEVAAVQKEDINYDTLIHLFKLTKKQSQFMVLYLTKCQEQNIDFEEAQFDLEGVVMGADDSILNEGGDTQSQN